VAATLPWPPAGAGVFVTGTDTGVGKTVVACLLVRELRRRGFDVGVMKPVETGVDARGPQDALALIEAAGGGDPLDDVCPQPFALPAAPVVAAAVEGTAVDLEAVRRAFGRLRKAHSWLVVEGAGGLLVPVAPGISIADLAVSMRLPLLIVARAALGTINHTLLTLEAASARHLPVAGVVISHGTGDLSAADRANLGALRQALGSNLVGELPPLLADELPPPGSLAVDRLLSTLVPGSR
jgi:dethiobiotin synthetase